MVIKKELGDLINAQINMEFYSANVYLTMASYCMNQGLKGFGQFFVVQMQEEQFHAMKYFNFFHDVEGKFVLSTIQAPSQDYTNVKQVFETALKNEEAVTQSTYNLIDKALSLKDFGTYAFLEWFVKEQIEEEALFRDLLDKLSMVENDKTGLFFLDAELGKRTFSAPKGD
jgi:ferritin